MGKEKWWFQLMGWASTASWLAGKPVYKQIFEREERKNGERDGWAAGKPAYKPISDQSVRGRMESEMAAGRPANLRTKPTCEGGRERGEEEGERARGLG
jgi:hypothetical protein